MAWDLATAKAKVGGTYTDPEIQLAMDMTESVIDKYCDRNLIKATASEQTLNYRSWQLQARHFPIEAITDITLDGVSIDSANYTVDTEHGVIQFNGIQYAKSLLLSLIGGYDPLPFDLELAYWQVFSEVWTLNISTIGSSQQTVKTLKIDGVGQVQYDTNSALSTQSGIQGLIPEVAAGILDLYKLKYC